MQKTRYLILMLLAWCFVQSQNKDVTHYKDLTGTGEVFFNALIYNLQEKNLPSNDTGLIYLDSAVSFYLNNYQNCKLSNALTAKARLYLKRDQNDSAAHNFLRASVVIKDDCSEFDKYYLYISWGILQEKIEEYNLADSLYRLASESSLQLENKTYWLNTRVNLVNILVKKDLLDSAIVEGKKILQYANEYQIEEHQYFARQNLGAYYYDKGEYDSAIFYLNQLGEILDVDKWPVLAMDMNNNLALSYSKLGESEFADQHYQTAIAMARKHDNFSKLVKYLRNYSWFLSLEGDFENSRNLLDEYVEIKDSLFSAEKFETIKLLETQYKVALQREELLQQNLELERNVRNRNTLLFVLGAVLLILIGVYSRLNYTSKAKKVVEKEKKRSDDLLLNILPAQVAEELKETGESEARNFEQVTVLFTDFKDFTTLSEILNAKELVGEINKFFKAFDGIVTEYGVEKIKTIGDAYMAASGLPKKSDEMSSALNAVHAAMAMMDIANELNAINEKEGRPLFNMRIGLHTGPVVAGIVGVKKFQYDIWGDTVNTAARMESSCEPGRINISRATYDLVKDASGFGFDMRGKIHAKGKGEMEMYYVSRT